MRVRKIIGALALMTLLSVSIGGYLVYHVVDGSIQREAQTEAENQMDVVAAWINQYGDRHRETVGVLAGLPELRQALLDGGPGAIEKANGILDHFVSGFGVSVCYLMDVDGHTIASSNRLSPTSFVGKNYAFRPYFQRAIQGLPSLYLALGVTSGKRGAYFSHPIYDTKQDRSIGVVVVKAGAGPLDEAMFHLNDGFSVLADPNGAVFASNREDWLYNVLWKADPEGVARIAASRQFGKGPWRWTGMVKAEDDRALDAPGNEYRILRREIDEPAGWYLTYLHDHGYAVSKITGPLYRSIGLLVLVTTVIVGLFSLLLYRRGGQEITRRDEMASALKKSEERYRVLFNNAHEAIHIAQDNRIRFPNPRAIEVFGYPEEELTRMPFSDLVHEEDKGLVQDRHERRLRGEKLPSSYSYRIVTKAGDTRWVELKVTAIPWENRPATLCFLSDITERVEAETTLRESTERLLSQANSAADAIVSIDSRSIIAFWNDAAEKMFGYTRAEIVGQDVAILMPEGYREMHRQGMTRFHQTGESEVVGKTVELQGARKDGTEFPLELSISAWNTRETVFFTGIIRDITQRTQTEEERNRLVLELQDALANVQTLRGLLPICASCKKIRDDTGYWNRIESYIETRSEAEFSHSICPDCVKTLYPEYADDEESIGPD